MGRPRPQSPTKPVRDRARDNARRLPTADRLAVVEEICAETKRTLDVQFTRIAAIQAQLDHLAAKLSGR
jgi:hypothetical protein